jgi:CHAT domain-containing protein/tetratricopeptide (TPR) repeat protein
LLDRLPRLRNKSAQAKFLSKHPEFLKVEVVSWLADLVRDQSKVDTATTIPLAQLAMAIAAKLRDKSALARSQRAMGNALYSSGQNKLAIKYHEQARTMFAALHNRVELARTLSASTQPLILTGNYRRALANAKQARTILSKLGDRGRVARLDVNIGNIFHRQDRFAEALKWYERAHRYFLDDAEKDPEGMAAALHNIAMCLVSLSDFQGALAAHQEARAIAQKYGLHVVVGQADYNIAALYYLHGEHSRAIGMLLATREACRKTNDQYHVALCNLDLSEIYVQLNLAGPAEEMALEAAAGFQKLGMSYEEGKSLVNVALAMAQQNKTAPALEMLGKARQQFIKEKNSAWPFLTDLYHAAILIDQGRPEEARRMCAGASHFFKTARIPSKRAQCELLMARASLLAGKPQVAKRQCAAALVTLETVELPLLSCQAQQLMGQIYRATGSVREAYEHYQKARRLLEKTRTALHNEEMKISFMEDKQEIYEGLIQMCLESKTEGHRLEEAFGYIEESKSRILQDLMSSSEISDLNPGTDENHDKVIKLRSEINWYSHKLSEEQLRGPEASHKVMADLQAAIRKRENEVLRLVREMSVTEAVSAGLSTATTATFAEIRESMTADSTLVEYFQIKDRLLAAILTQESFEIAEVTEVNLVAPLIEKLHFQLAKFRMGAEYANTFADSLLNTTLQHLRELYEKLFVPVEGLVKGRHLVVVPHGVLHRLPFQALFDGTNYLIDKFTISYAPSATVHSLCHRRPVNSRGCALVMGVPDAAAPLIGDEATAIAGIIPDAELFLGKNATTDVLWRKGADCRLIHIATHGYFRQDSPLFSGIRLGDSVLTLMDLYRMKLPAELVTLSGCATGANAVAGGDELLGLVRGLVYAGARATLLSLWDVHDRSTLEFMTLFYGHLAAGASKVIALQKAAQRVREGYPHPYYWAAFSLVGNVAS